MMMTMKTMTMTRFKHPVVLLALLALKVVIPNIEARLKPHLITAPIIALSLLVSAYHMSQDSLQMSSGSAW